MNNDYLKWNPFAVLSPMGATDCYKCGHVFQYPENSEFVYSNFTPRSSKHAGDIFTADDQKVVVWGLTAFVKWFLIYHFNENFFGKSEQEAVGEYAELMDSLFGPGAIKVDHIRAVHRLGYLPIEIRALDEGSRVDFRIPTMTVKNTKPFAYWVVNYLETILSAENWQPMTVATIAYEFRRVLEKYTSLTGTDRSFINWQGHDFSMRGMTGMMASANASSGHLTSFWGTDCIPAVEWVRGYYNGAASPVLGGSVPATEHSVMCAGTMESEIETFRRLMKIYPSGILSIVSDTWDYWQVITDYAVQLKNEILARTDDSFGNAKVVFRPDSGDPVKILSGYTADEYTIRDGKFYANDTGKELMECEVKGSVECLWDIFGGTTNDLGFRTLDRHVGLIYGDSITIKRADEILRRLMDKKFAANNVVFGIGSFSYQYLTRDSFGFAMKATACTVAGEFRELYKDPKTDDGTKKSARGLLRVEKVGDEYVLHERQTFEQEQTGELKVVFRDGELLCDTDIADVRHKLWGSALSLK